MGRDSAGPDRVPSRAALPASPTRITRSRAGWSTGPASWAFADDGEKAWVFDPVSGLCKLPLPRAAVERVASKFLSRDGMHVRVERGPDGETFLLDVTAGMEVLDGPAPDVVSNPRGETLRIHSRRLPGAAEPDSYTLDSGDGPRRLDLDGYFMGSTRRGPNVHLSWDGASAAFGVRSDQGKLSLIVVSMSTGSLREYEHMMPDGGAAWNSAGDRLLVHPWRVDRTDRWPAVLDLTTGETRSLSDVIETRSGRTEAVGWIDERRLLISELSDRRLRLFAADIDTRSQTDLLEAPCSVGPNRFSGLQVAWSVVHGDPSKLWASH